MSGRRAPCTPLSLLPDGEAVEARLGLESQAARGAISADGSRVAWEETNKALYLRLNATAPQSASGACDEAGRACTVQLDEKQGGPGISGGGKYQFMSADGSRVFFTDTQPLTADSGANRIRPPADLYECRVVEPSPGHHACALTDLTPRQGVGEEPAEVKGGLLGAAARTAPTSTSSPTASSPPTRSKMAPAPNRRNRANQTSTCSKTAPPPSSPASPPATNMTGSLCWRGSPPASPPTATGSS